MQSSVRSQVILCLPIYVAAMFAPSTSCQTTPSQDQNAPAAGAANRAIPAQVSPSSEQLPKRLFGIIPNYRSHPSFRDSQPLTTKEKFRLAARDTFDPGNFLLAGMIAGVAQATDSTSSYGQGMAGYGRYYGSSYGDIVIGNAMTTGVYPSLFHQDPRYFRRGNGSAWSRLGYAMGQVFLTHGDNRKTQFNFSEICGNSTAVAISNAYNPDNRTAVDAASKLGFQLGLDMAGNILKEFVPDLSRKLSGKKRTLSHPGPSSVK